MITLGRIVIIGVDPGLVCGVAQFAMSDGEGEFSAWSSDWITCCEYVEGELPTADTHGRNVVVATERYTLGHGTRTNQPEALMTNGALAYLTQRAVTRGHGFVRFLVQGAGDAVVVANRKTLTHVGWWTTADPDQHRNRAAAQVALALLTLFPREWHRLINRDKV